LPDGVMVAHGPLEA